LKEGKDARNGGVWELGYLVIGNRKFTGDHGYDGYFLKHEEHENI